MDEGQEPVYARGLYRSLRDGAAGQDAYATVVAPWLGRAQDGYRAALAQAASRLCREPFDGPRTEREDLSWEFYALSRVSDVLLLAFQPPLQPAPGSTGGVPFAHELHPPEQWPEVETAQYLELFTGLGMEPFTDTGAFDPFLHEIVEVEQAQDPDEPVSVTELLWPGLWLGPLLFSRAGVRVRAGIRHAERGVADRFPMYWTFLRRNRPTVDLSLGWGHNSQWRTDFRVDHRTAAGDRRVNAGVDEDIDSDEAVGEPGTLLTPEERRELVRNRCLLRTPSNAAALAGTSHWEREIFPFDWRLPEA
jgi:hypothetical protein